MKRRNALSLVETLIGLAIMALLLTGMGAAFQASCAAIENNDQFYRAQQSARIALNQILDQVRQCQSGLVDNNSLELTTYTGQDCVYAQNGTNLTVTFTPVGGIATTAQLASNVQTLTFNTDGKSISMLITVSVGNNQLTLCGSAFPRRLVTYN